MLLHWIWRVDSKLYVNVKCLIYVAEKIILMSTWLYVTFFYGIIVSWHYPENCDRIYNSGAQHPTPVHSSIRLNLRGHLKWYTSYANRITRKTPESDWMDTL